jgi:isopenicillin N synthase-like dioxygenase
MLWHRLPLDETKMQMLTADERQFPFAPGDSGGDGSTNSSAQDFEIAESAIDMSPYCKQTAYYLDYRITTQQQLKAECFTKLNETLHRDGFALVRGTNISSSLCNSALKAAKTFLHDADESVRRCCLTTDRARRGYSPISTENFASLIGEKGPNDLVKKFRIGPEQVDGGEENEQKCLSSLHQPNAWPNEEVWDQSAEFRSTIDQYYNELRVAADCVLRAICDGILAENADLANSLKVVTESTCGVSEKAVDANNHGANHTSILTLLGYQPGSRHKKGSKGFMNPLVAAHTDVGMITVLLFDDGKCASLQRCASSTAEGEVDATWADVKLPSSKYLEGGNDPGKFK